MFDLVDVLAAHHRLEKIIVRTLITTIMLLLFTSQAQVRKVLQTAPAQQQVLMDQKDSPLTAPTSI